ncbi:hypothetical protein CDAR_276611 [Caerostris darwini]|uniref:Uncharacterized protein n=1 Tax=Caerostris darwini TaxID=1538125 RepID=A0AAV4MXY0_9ARAC|nr:hypothetical protein CDAR_276611 [Caerostris darwini]
MLVVSPLVFNGKVQLMAEGKKLTSSLVEVPLTPDSELCVEVTQYNNWIMQEVMQLDSDDSQVDVDIIVRWAVGGYQECVLISKLGLDDNNFLIAEDYFRVDGAFNNYGCFGFLMEICYCII